MVESTIDMNDSSKMTTATESPIINDKLASLLAAYPTKKANKEIVGTISDTLPNLIGYWTELHPVLNAV